MSKGDVKYIFSLTMLVIMAMFLCCSCEPQKRINHILNKHPELKRDTVFVLHDTVITKHFNFDTLYNYTLQHDTVVLQRENVQVKVYHHNDTMYLNTIVKPDTLIKTIKVPVKQVVYTVDERKNLVMFWIGFGVALFIVVVLLLVLIYFKII